MAGFALGVALVAVVLALVAQARAGAAGRRAEQAELAARSAGKQGAEETRAALETLRLLFAAHVEGVPLDRAAILEGRLWRDVQGAEAARLVEGGCQVLDVRSAEEQASGVLPGARRLPIDALEARLAELPRDPRGTLIYCSAGGRSAAACEFLATQGFRGLANLEGGIGAWPGALVDPRTLA